MASWFIAMLIATSAAAAVVLLARDRRPRTRPPGFRSSQADPLHQHATHYLASGALPRWDP
jgi:hypothetical protein